MANIRTFIAVDVAPGIRTAAARQISALQSLGVDGYNWVKPGEMHITLKFLGNIQDSESPEVCKLVEQAVKDSPAISVSVGGIGAFPDSNRPRTLWMGVTEGVEEIQELQKRVDLAMKKMGFPLERPPFVPHITLGRLPRGAHSSRTVADYLAKNSDRDFGGFDIDQVIVYSSFDDKSGRSYTPMATIDLSG